MEEDISKALEWYRKSAARNVTEAEIALGDCYVFGLGVEKNYETGRKWFEKALSEGDLNGSWRLGKMYREGWKQP